MIRTVPAATRSSSCGNPTNGEKRLRRGGVRPIRSAADSLVAAPPGLAALPEETTGDRTDDPEHAGAGGLRVVWLACSATALSTTTDIDCSQGEVPERSNGRSRSAFGAVAENPIASQSGVFYGPQPSRCENMAERVSSTQHPGDDREHESDRRDP